MAIVSLARVEAPVNRSVSKLARRACLAWRSLYGFGWAEASILLIFAGIAGYARYFHEPWSDEAQAWLIARDNSAWNIVRHRTHYEGAPPGWHLLLHMFHALGGNYVGMGWLGVALAVVGMYVWLRWSPFPAAIRFLIPFTFFFEYQYAVVARSYCLFPLLAFSICALYRHRQRVVGFAVAAGLLANVSMQGFVLAMTFVGLYVYDLWRMRAACQVKSTISKNKLLVAAGIFGCMSCISIYCAIPAPDLNFGIGDNVSTGVVHRILLTLIGETPRNVPSIPPETPIIDTRDHWTPPPFQQHPLIWIRKTIDQPPNHVTPGAIPWVLRTFGPGFLDLADDATWPLANSNLVAVTFLVVTALWLRARLQLRMLGLWIALLAASHVLWMAEQHAGLFVIAILSGIWIAADAPAARASGSRLEGIFISICLVVIIGQIAWSVASIRDDVKGSYDPGLESARWIQAHAKPRMAAFGFHTVSIEPWFSRSPFFDMPTSFWQWSSNVQIDGNHRAIISSHPDLVVYGLELPGKDQIREQWLPVDHPSAWELQTLPYDNIVKDLRDHGYQATHRFCGKRFTRLDSGLQNCHIIFQPIGQSD